MYFSFIKEVIVTYSADFRKRVVNAVLNGKKIKG